MIIDHLLPSAFEFACPDVEALRECLSLRNPHALNSPTSLSPFVSADSFSDRRAICEETMSPPANSSASPLVSLTKTVNGSHKFTIRGYSLAKCMGVGKHIASENFTVGGYQWAVYFYPDGKNPEDNSAYVSVFIAFASEGTDFRALFELKLLDQSGRGKHKVHSHFDRSFEGGPYTLKYRGSMW